MNSKLYIVEGLPSSGKSTTSEFVCDILRASGIDAAFVDEGSGNHPADFEFHSFILPDIFETFSSSEQAVILANSQHKYGGFVVPLASLSSELFGKVLQYKIYDYLDWETERRVMLGRWLDFADNCSGTYVFNCCLIQNPMCETMMRFGFDTELSKDYISEICGIISGLEPVVIYLKSDDIESSVLRTIPERGEEWLNAVIDYHINGGYGKSAGLSGFDGYISCLEERQRRELEILKNLPVKSLIIENAHEDWDAAYNKIREFII